MLRHSGAPSTKYHICVENTVLYYDLSESHIYITKNMKFLRKYCCGYLKGTDSAIHDEFRLLENFSNVCV